MEDIILDFNGFNITKSHKNRVISYVRYLLKIYDLEGGSYFKIKFKPIYQFGNCLPSFRILKREVKILINKDLLKENLFEELKGTLAHEFAHFFHYKNFSQSDYLLFLFKAGFYTFSRKVSKGKIVVFVDFMKAYEQYTDLTVYSFGLAKELIKLKLFMPKYRKTIPSYLVPSSANYLSAKFLQELDELTFKTAIDSRLKKINLKSLKFNKNY